MHWIVVAAIAETIGTVLALSFAAFLLAVFLQVVINSEYWEGLAWAPVFLSGLVWLWQLAASCFEDLGCPARGPGLLGGTVLIAYTCGLVFCNHFLI